MEQFRKYAQVQKFIKNLKRLIIAFSGGVDSTLVLKVAYDVLGHNVLAITADSPSVPRKELGKASRLAKLIGVWHLVLGRCKTATTCKIQSTAATLFEACRNSPEREISIYREWNELR